MIDGNARQVDNTLTRPWVYGVLYSLVQRSLTDLTRIVTHSRSVEWLLISEVDSTQCRGLEVERDHPVKESGACTRPANGSAWACGAMNLSS
jgi:hypothetical protein